MPPIVVAGAADGDAGADTDDVEMGSAGVPAVVGRVHPVRARATSTPAAIRTSVVFT